MTPSIPRERRLLRKALSSSRECATLSQLERLGEPDARVWEHVASCPRCQAEWTILSAFESATPLPGEEQDVKWISQRLAQQFEADGNRAPKPSARIFRLFDGRAFAAGGLAAAVLVVARSVVFFMREGRVPVLKTPTIADARTLRSEEVVTKGPMGELETAPSQLRWTAVPGAVSYSVRLMEVDRAEVWTHDIAATSAALPQGVLSQLVPGKPMLWQVTAKDGEGFAIAQSGVQRFKIRAKGQ
jgi:hypothetical protein